MRILLASLVVLGILPALCAGQASSAPGLGPLLPADVSGWKPSGDDRVFTRDTIFDYLDGGGEIYLAYAFRSVLVREYVDDTGARLVAEVYDMSNSADAFGIFANDQDGEDAAVGNEGLYGAGLLRFWKGRYFVRLMAERETAGTKDLLMGLGLRVAAAVRGPGAKPRLLAALPDAGREAKSIRYFHKQVSLNAQYYLADENVLNLDERTEVALAKYRAGDGKAMVLVCRYPSEAEAVKAFRRFGRDYFAKTVAPDAPSLIDNIDDEEFAGMRRVAGILIVVLESPDRLACASLLDGVASKIGEVDPWKNEPRNAKT